MKEVALEESGSTEELVGDHSEKSFKRDAFRMPRFPDIADASPVSTLVDCASPEGMLSVSSASVLANVIFIIFLGGSKSFSS